MSVSPQVMKVTGPLLVFGGPYSNLEATKAMLAEARRRAIAPGNIVCTGDLVAIAPTRQKLERPALARARENKMAAGPQAALPPQGENLRVVGRRRGRGPSLEHQNHPT
jgi:hypothetical protein